MGLFWFYVKYFRRLVRFYARAITIYDIHSPFVASFLQFVLLDRRMYYAFGVIEMLRGILLKNKYPMRVSDDGEGAKRDAVQVLEIRDIVRLRGVSPLVGRCLFRTVVYQKPESILELGTSLGISTLYLRMAARVSPFVTLAGGAEMAMEARNNLWRLGCSDVEVVTGHISEAMAEVLPRFSTLDLVYWGRGQPEESTYSCFRACLEKAGPESIFIFADIHRTDEMEETWARMRAHPGVRASLDVFRLGFLFFDDRLKHPVHIDFVPWYVKPWRSGIFH
jgi:predicted O-methyltransferase YrrM